MSDVILNVSDWNYEDKWYRLPLELLKTFGEKVRGGKIVTDASKISPDDWKRIEVDRSAAWSWLCENVDYWTIDGTNEETKGRPIVRCDSAVDHTLEEYFWDWEQPIECVYEWLEQWADE